MNNATQFLYQKFEKTEAVTLAQINLNAFNDYFLSLSSAISLSYSSSAI